MDVYYDVYHVVFIYISVPYLHLLPGFPISSPSLICNIIIYYIILHYIIYNPPNSISVDHIYMRENVVPTNGHNTKGKRVPLQLISNSHKLMVGFRVLISLLEFLTGWLDLVQ